MNSMEGGTLAQRPGMTVPFSPLLEKAERLGFDTPEKIEDLARVRGLQYFSDPLRKVNEETVGYVAGESLSNEEIAICLLSMALPYSQQRIRMGGAMLAASGNDPALLARLAVGERCERVVHYIASLGFKVEPQNPFWDELLRWLPEFEPPRPDLLPHITRFVAMTGVTRNGRETVMQWIRPRSAME
jgi:hypothetical protein